jgi:hypothetical protein
MALECLLDFFQSDGAALSGFYDRLQQPGRQG